MKMSTLLTGKHVYSVCVCLCMCLHMSALFEGLKRIQCHKDTHWEKMSVVYVPVYCQYPWYSRLHQTPLQKISN